MPPETTAQIAEDEGTELQELSGKKGEKETHAQETRSFRTTFPQVLATMTQSMLMLAVGMLITLPTLVIGALHNAENGLSLNDQQASWFAGLLFIFQPLGSLLAGVLQDPFGRKKCMVLVNIPQLAGWLLVHYAQSVGALMAAAICIGFSIGFKEAPTLSYVGEITQPHLRGTLASFTSAYVSCGILLMFLLGSLVDWRTAAAISTAVPVITAIGTMQLPESPLWLLMKGREKEAVKSLCWLRGWVTPDKVQSEIERMKKHLRDTKAAKPAYQPLSTDPEVASPNADVHGAAPRRSPIVENLKQMLKPTFLRPLNLVVFFFMFMHCASLYGSRPYLVRILKRLEVPIKPELATVLAGTMQLCGSLMCTSLARKMGRRKLSIISMIICSLITFSIGLYSLLHEKAGVNLSWIPLVLIASLFFAINTGIGVVPWTLLSEVFPSRLKGMGGGISAAMYYVWFFIISKTFLDMERWLELYGVYFFYGILGGAGVVFLYYYLPETEGRRLDEVERFFSSKKKARKMSPDVV